MKPVLCEKKRKRMDFGYIAPIGSEELKAAMDVLKSKRLSGFYKDFLGGEKVRKFERSFAAYIGVKHAIAVNSGTSALHAAIAACGIGPGDEVIVPPFTFTATASAVLMNNAIPVFADIKEDTLCISPAMIEHAVTKRTKMIIPVHIYGKTADMDSIMSIAKKNRLFVIEDACQAPGARIKNKKAGSIGDAGVFSFVETKNMVIGEGGMVTTNDGEIARRCRLIRNHGECWMEGRPREYLSNMLGYNFRMTEITAAIGIEQLKKLDYLNGVRVENAGFLQEALARFDGIRPVEFGEGEVCHIFPFFFDEKKAGISKKRFTTLAASKGIPVTPGYPHPLYKNPIFREKIAYGKKGCPYTCAFYKKDIDYASLRCRVAEKACENLLCIKEIHYPYGIGDMRYIADTFEKILRNRQGAS